MTKEKRTPEELSDQELEQVSGGTTVADNLGLTVNPLADPRPSPLKNLGTTTPKT